MLKNIQGIGWEIYLSSAKEGKENEEISRKVIWSNSLTEKIKLFTRITNKILE